MHAVQVHGPDPCGHDGGQQTCGDAAFERVVADDGADSAQEHCAPAHVQRRRQPPACRRGFARDSGDPRAGSAYSGESDRVCK